MKTVVNDLKWLETKFIKQVQERGQEIFNTQARSPACSASNAITDHIHDLYFGTWPGLWTSMGVKSDGNQYGVPKDLYFSFPVTIRDKLPAIVNGLKMTTKQLGKIQTTINELLEERKVAYSIIGMN